MPQAIFFDLGSTLWDDYPTELYQWEYLTARLNDCDVSVTLADIIAESHQVIDSYCPSLTRSIVYRLLQGDLEQYRGVIADLVSHTAAAFADPETFRKLNPLFPGVPELLAQLQREYRLAVVSQHFTEASRWMSFHGIDGYFDQITLSDDHKLYKPDPRLFELTSRSLGLNCRDVVMVGDRLDNDIWPANRLGMTSVRVLGDPYRRQQPRYHSDVPDYTIDNVLMLPAVLDQLRKL